MSEHIARARHRARQRGLPATLTRQEWVETVMHFHGCAYCGEVYTTVDHVTPLSHHGGTTVIFSRVQTISFL